jgi:hypothetical protein
MSSGRGLNISRLFFQRFFCLTGGNRRFQDPDSHPCLVFGYPYYYCNYYQGCWLRDSCKFFWNFRKRFPYYRIWYGPGRRSRHHCRLYMVTTGYYRTGDLSDPRHHEYANDVITPLFLSELAFPERKGLTRRNNIVE